MCDSSDDNRSYAVKFSVGTAVGVREMPSVFLCRGVTLCFRT